MNMKKVSLICSILLSNMLFASTNNNSLDNTDYGIYDYNVPEKTVKDSKQDLKIIDYSKKIQSLEEEIKLLKTKINKLAQTKSTKNIKKIEKKVKKNYKKLKKLAKLIQRKINPKVSNDHLYWSANLRTKLHYVNFKDKTGKVYTNDLLTNKFQFTAIARPLPNTGAVFTLQAYSIYGASNSNVYSPLQSSNLVVSTIPNDTNIRIKEGYFYHVWGDGKYLFSAGRRPATNGFPINYREDVPMGSPLAHSFNLNFDGIAFMLRNPFFSELNDKFSEWNSNLKICAGRGYSSNKGKFPTDGTPPYSKDELKTNNFVGFIFTPIDNGKLNIRYQYVYAWNAMGFNFDKDPNNLLTLGDYQDHDLGISYTGFTDSGYFSTAVAWLDIAASETMPKSGYTMLGSSKDRWGWSILAGMDLPGFAEDMSDRLGFNIVYGSKYWRNMTYGEDTLIGSMMATRGLSYNFYYHKNINNNLSFGFDALYLKFNHSGSNGFFGDTSDPDQENYIKRSLELSTYLKFKF